VLILAPLQICGKITAPESFSVLFAWIPVRGGFSLAPTPVVWWGSKGGKETKFFCVWGVIGKTHGLPRAPSSRELSAKLTEGAAERSEADEDKKLSAAAAIFPQKKFRSN
jgi:hypothetical protein